MTDLNQGLAEAEAFCARMNQSMAPAVDPKTTVSDSKYPFWAHLIRELTFYRTAELCTSACSCFRSNQAVSGIVLTRAGLESIALLIWTHARVESAVKNQKLDEIGQFLNKVLEGTKIEGREPQASSILSAIDAADRTARGFRATYDRLSETAHPNDIGLRSAYSVDDMDEFVVKLSRDKLNTDYNMAIGILPRALDIFIATYEEMPSLLKEFATLCDEECSKAFSRD